MSPSSVSLPGLSLITLRDLRARPDLLVAPESVLPGLVYKGRMTLFAGREKGGKSTFAAAGVAALSAGVPFLGEPTSPCDTLWLSSDREAWYDLNERFERFGADPDRVHLVFGWSGDVNAFHHLLEQTTPGLVVVDTLLSYAMSRVRESSRPDQWPSVLLPLGEYAHRTGCGILLNHHASRATGEYRDSTAIGGYVDLIVEMYGRGQDESAQGSVRSFKVLGRLAGLPDFKVRYLGDRFVLEDAAASLEDRVVGFVADHEKDSKPPSKTAIREGLGGNHGAVDSAIASALANGRVCDVNGASSHGYRLARPTSGQNSHSAQVPARMAPTSETLVGLEGAGSGSAGAAGATCPAAPEHVCEGAGAGREAEGSPEGAVATHPGQTGDACPECGGELVPARGTEWGLECSACGFRP